MRWVVANIGVVLSSSQWIRYRAQQTEILTPVVGCGSAEAMDWADRHLSLERMIVVVTSIGVVVDCLELRVGDNEVVREPVYAECRSNVVVSRIWIRQVAVNGTD